MIAGDGGRVPDAGEQRAEIEQLAHALMKRWIDQANAERYIGGPNTSPMVEPDEYDVDDPPDGMIDAARRDVLAVLSDPASVLAALLAESPEATVAALEALLTREAPLRAAAHVMYEAPPEADVARVWDVALSAACRSLLSKAPKEDGDA